MKAKVLVVEDDHDIAELVRLHLVRAGFETDLVTSGDEVLPRLREARPDLVVLDVMLPGLSGLEVCRLVRADAELAAVPIVMVTARVHEEDRVAGFEIGADDYVTKPFSPRELVARVKAVLRRTKSLAADQVVNIGSIDGITTPYYEAFPYGPSKAAVHHLTRILAARLVREHILVNAIAPGPFPSRMLSSGIGAGPDPSVVDWETTGEILPRGRVGSVEDIAGLTIYLCSRAGAYTVGETITCDGGVMIVGSNNK